jgi:putative addiction module killer protein
MYPSEYIYRMYSIEKTDVFDKWLRKLKDQRAKAKILFRIQRIEEQGNFGDCEPVGQGISELRIHYAKGYRIYLREYNGRVVILLNGGTKSSQKKDIDKAKVIWLNYKDELEDGN